MGEYLLALDQGTTSSRAIVFDRQCRSIASAQQEFEQILPAPGEVEHDPEAIWKSQLATAQEALAKSQLAVDQIAAIGITNQRETTILWDRQTGAPVAPAIVWQSRVSSPLCQRHQAEGAEALVRRKTGLVLDSYFSATKIEHLLDSISGLRDRAERGEILFGTVDSFLIWRLTAGRHHVTDISNASRTLLYDIHQQDWDEELLRLFRVPRAMLPEVVASSGLLGHTEKSLLGAEIPIAACAGDQQAALFGQACFQAGDVKHTYGTGCFMLQNTGTKPVESQHQLLTTIGWQIGDQVTYCLEGSVFIGGAVVQWLRDGLGLIETSAQITELAASVPDSGGVSFVPAFVGLGAPYWDPDARGAIYGLSRGTEAGHLARAALESIAFQSLDLLEAMVADCGQRPRALQVDGGASANDMLLQFQADILNLPVRRPVTLETTALGAASLAGLAVGLWNDQQELASHWELHREFTPAMNAEDRDRHCHRWQQAVQKTLTPR